MTKATKPPEPATKPVEFAVCEAAPFKLGCCDCGLYHLVTIRVGSGREITVSIYRDEDATELERGASPAEQWEELRRECNARLKALRRKGK